MKMISPFEPFQLKNLSLRNRIVLPPMCMYVAEDNGFANDKHFVHYVTRAIGGTGLIIIEATAIRSEGRLTNQDLGLWSDEQIAPLAKVIHECKANGAKVALQINHGGRKGYRDAKGKLYAPSAIPFDDTYGVPESLAEKEILEIVELYKQAAQRAVAAGVDALEIHGAHGYLVSTFLSPLTNQRTDDFGGTTENRARFLQMVIQAFRSVMPKGMPLLLRVSAHDYAEGGMNVDEMIRIIDLVKQDLDMVHVSSGGVVPAVVPTFPGYQVEFARKIKEACQIPTIAVGLITTLEQVSDILNNDRSDLVALGRELWREPYWVMQKANPEHRNRLIPPYYNPSVFRRMYP